MFFIVLFFLLVGTGHQWEMAMFFNCCHWRCLSYSNIRLPISKVSDKTFRFLSRNVDSQFFFWQQQQKNSNKKLGHLGLGVYTPVRRWTFNSFYTEYTVSNIHIFDTICIFILENSMQFFPWFACYRITRICIHTYTVHHYMSGLDKTCTQKKHDKRHGDEEKEIWNKELLI